MFKILHAFILLALAIPAQVAYGQSGLERLQAEYRELYNKVSPSIVAVATQPYSELESIGGTATLVIRAAAGTGFVVTGGYVICDAERFANGGDAGEGLQAALEKLEELYVITAEGKSHKCEVAGHDLRSLLLVLKLPEDVHLPALTLGDSTKANIGSTVAAFGNSFDCFIVDHRPSFAIGSLADFYRFELDDLQGQAEVFGDPYRGNVFEVESTVNPGDEGGPLVNLQGEVIGMLSSHHYSGRHLGTAVPSSQFKLSFDTIAAGNPLPKAQLGFWLKNTATGKHCNPTITRFDPGSAAERAGLKVGDVVVMVDTLAINDRVGVRDALAVPYEIVKRDLPSGGPPGAGASRTVTVSKSYGLPPGAVISFIVRRGDQLVTIEATVGALAEDTKKPEQAE